MAQRTIIQLIDDIDGGQADQNVTFALDGVDYEIDLSEQNAARLRETMLPWAQAARRQSKGAPARPGSRRTQARRRAQDLMAIREWARGQGYTLSERGRVPYDIERAYRQAHA